MSTSFGGTSPGWAVVVFMVACLTLAATGVAAIVHGGTRVERAAGPPATSAFLRAYASRDVATAARLASPLYGDEWARRGFSTRELAAMLSREYLARDDGSPWITFTFLGGAADPRGFLHLLYSASVACTGRCAGPEVWRVDTDRDGRVIWAQMVWVFGRDVPTLVTSSDVNDVPWELLPREMTVGDPRLVLAVRSATSIEGYFEMVVRAPVRTVVFFAVDADARVRAGSWAFRDPYLLAGENGKPAASAGQPLTREEEALRRAYIESLP